LKIEQAQQKQQDLYMKEQLKVSQDSQKFLEIANDPVEEAKLMIPLNFTAAQ
jgi:hypothetical protein